MTIGYLLLVGLCLGIARHVYAVDLTLKHGENSKAVIDATIRKIRTKCILAEDYYFLRRLAETQMQTIPAGMGGIWRVTNNQLATVKNACKNTLIVYCSRVQTFYGVDVSTLTMYDLEKPLYSGLVMSLFILNLNTPIPVSKGLQANYWKQHIMPHGRKIFFIRLANQLEQRNDCANAQIDLVFVIDSSGSVEKPDFEKTKNFLENIVFNLDIGPDKTRVAVIRFANDPHVAFSLGDHSTNFAVRQAIKAITYDGSGTATDLALDKTHISVFTNKRKSVAAKVLVLVTDGKSNSENKTVAAAQKLKDDGVIIFTIGVVNPKVSELIAAASEPSCTHFIVLKDYDAIGFIVKEIESDSCKAPTVVQTQTQLRNVAIPKTNETKQQVLQITNTTKSALGTTVVVKVQCGVVTVYASFHNSYPNEADYDYKALATDDQPGKLFLAEESELNKLALTVLSKTRFDLKSSACNNPSYDININPTAPTVVEEHTQLLNMAIPKTNETKQQVLQVTNTTKSTLGTTVLVKVQCGVVTVYGSFNNSYPNEADYDYKISATDYQPGKLFLVQESELDKLFLTVFSKKRFDLNSSACNNPSYNVSINPTASRVEAACLVKHVHSPCTAKQLDSACYNATPVVGEISQLLNNSILKNGKIQEHVLEITNSTDSSGSAILVSVRCAEVTVYGAFNNRYPTEDDYDYKTYAKDGSPGKITLERESQIDNLTLTVLSKKQQGLNSSTCDHPSYTVIIEPKDSTREVVCHRKQDEQRCIPVEHEFKCSTTPRTEMACLVKEVNSPCTAKQLDSACYDSTPVVGEVSQLYNNSILGNDEIREQVLEISNSTDSSGNTILVSTQCAEVIVYGAFTNRYPFEADHDYKTTAADSNPGKIIIAERESQTDNLTLTILSKRQRGLNSSDCDHPSYTVIINPEDSKLEVVCHRKQDERHCTPAESESKYSKTSEMCTSTASDIGVTKQLLINAWIYAGLLLLWQMA